VANSPLEKNINLAINNVEEYYKIKLKYKLNKN